MKDTNRKTAILCAVSLAVGAAGIGALKAQQAAPSVNRKIVLKQDMTIPGKEGVMALVELPPGSAEGRHTHPAEVFVFVQEGTVDLEVEGKPTATYKAGDSFYIAPGLVHQGINKGTATAKLSVVFVADKGKPLSTPAP